MESLKGMNQQNMSSSPASDRLVLKLDEGINSIDLSSYNQYVSWHHLNAWFPGEVGENHHKLLAYLSSQLPDNSFVVDLGTQFGASALSLSYNKNVKVQTYDIGDYIPQGKKSYRDVPNITSIQGSCFNYVKNFAGASIILLDISPHDGADERKMIGMLLENDYKGLLICDDINLSEAMKNFWNDVPLKKHDVTRYGHWSGTGIIVFDKETIDVRVS